MLIEQGAVDLLLRDGTKFMQLPELSVFNDYQLLFGLKSNIVFRSFTPTYVSEKQMDDPMNKTRTMNLNADTFQELLELYPETAQNLKLRALEKRSIFMYYKHKVDSRRRRQRLGRAGMEMEPPKEEKSSRLSSRVNPLLYKSTYKGPKEDSDDDEFHLTMPFKHNETFHQEILDVD